MDAQNTWYYGCRFRWPAGFSTGMIFMSVNDAGSTQMGLAIMSGNKIGLYRGGTNVATGTTVLTANTWYYIELAVYPIHSTTGNAKVRINEVDEPNLVITSGNTQATGNATADQLFVGGIASGASGQSTDVCDLVACDGQTTSSGANTFLGDCRVEILYPTGTGNSTLWTPSTGSNWATVDEAQENGDTDYVETTAVGNKDTYVYADLATSQATIYGVQPSPVFKKTDSGTRTVATVARVAGTEVDSSGVLLTTSYVCAPDMRETKPGGGSWAVSDVNGAEFGIKVTV